jgi:Transmembrane amino acid transporter protein
LGAIAISVNSLCGPALLQLPFQYQQSGLIPTTLCLIGVGVLASLVTLHMANVVSKVPGNANFDKTVEFSDPFRTFWGNRAYYMTQLIFYLCTISLNIAAIVDTAAVVDSFLGHTTGSYALAVDQLWGDSPQPIQEWHHGKCSRRAVKRGVCEPFSGIDIHNHGAEFSDFLITSGYIIAAAVFLPICLMDLKVR